MERKGEDSHWTMKDRREDQKAGTDGERELEVEMRARSRTKELQVATLKKVLKMHLSLDVLDNFIILFYLLIKT